MIAVITGHLAGIGKLGAEVLSGLGYEVIGFDKSDGQDISLEDVQKQIIEKSLIADVFLNNAYHVSAQTKLALEWAAANKSRKTHMVTSSSTVVDAVTENQRWWEYRIAKIGLEEAAKLTNNSTYACKVTTVRFGMVATELFLKHHPGFDTKKCLTTEAVKQLLELAFTFKNNGAPLRLISSDTGL
jgi:nucleoside-diphosphate-sugar epimerase